MDALALSLLRMPDHVDLELEVQQDTLFVAKKLFQMLGKNVNSRVEVGAASDNSFLIPRNIFFKNGKKYVFFISEIIVESAAGLPCPSRDVFNASRLEAVAREEFPGSLHELLARNECPFLLVGGDFNENTLSARDFIESAVNPRASVKKYTGLYLFCTDS